MTQRQYNESSIKILEGLEPVKLRPGQFTRTVDPLHIVQEVIDNAIDECIAGFAKNIGFSLLPDGYVRVSDDGRGIPVGIHPEKKIPTVQAIFTVLYSGGKFDKASGGAYSYAGGLHGVGVSVTNALSESLVASVIRDGYRHEIGFADGDVVQPLRRVGKEVGTGTTVTLKPNSKYFDSPELPHKTVRELLRTKAILLPGLTVTFIDARNPESPKEEVFCYQDGIPSFLDEIAGEDPLTPVIVGKAYASADNDNFAEGEGAEWAFSWYERGDGKGRSYVNLIPTPDDGTHVSGLRSALFNALRAHIDHMSMLPKGLKLTADDVFKSVRFVLSARMLDPSFDNQTKDRLNTRDAVKLVEQMAQPQVEAWLNHNPGHAKTIAELVIRNAQARTRASLKVERKRGSSVVMLPGKLSDCESQDANLTEIFLVEGDSAGGSAKQARDKHFQAILPLRGKGQNTWETDVVTALANEENSNISIALGIPPHKLTDDVDFSKLRYGKICILADADVDGYHIQVLLMTFFLRHFPQLIARGHIYVARPPLFRIDVEASGKKRGAKKLYAMDSPELKMWEDRLAKEGYSKWRVGRFKGLGEMNPPELYETTLSPDTRRLLKAELPEELREIAAATFDNLMGKKNASWRREWMERRGDEVDSY
jgi:topoisomerase-4 subunit B